MVAVTVPCDEKLCKAFKVTLPGLIRIVCYGICQYKHEYEYYYWQQVGP